MAGSNIPSSAADVIIQGHAMRLVLKPVVEFFDDPGQQLGPTAGEVTLHVDSVPRACDHLLIADESRCDAYKELHEMVQDPEHDFATKVTYLLARRVPLKITPSAGPIESL